jgi:hypothetical protein
MKEQIPSSIDEIPTGFSEEQWRAVEAETKEYKEKIEQEIQGTIEQFQNNPEDLKKLMEERRMEAAGNMVRKVSWQGEAPSDIVKSTIESNQSSRDLAEHQIFIFKEALDRMKQ